MKKYTAAELKAKQPAIIKEFRDFINRGNVMDLAIGVIVGGAFSKIVSSLVDNIITPIVSMLIGGIDFSDLKFTVPSYIPGVHSATLKYGLFLESVIDFLITAFVIFMIVRTINKVNERAKKALVAEEKKEKKEEKAAEDEKTKLLREIAAELKKANKK